MQMGREASHQQTVVAPDEGAFLQQHFDLAADEAITILQQGENLTYLARRHRDTVVIRRYRAQRFTTSQIEGEIAWLKALRPHLPVPAVIPTVDGQQVLQRHQDGNVSHYVAFEWLDGKHPDGDRAEPYVRLGRLMRQMHDAAELVMASAEVDWAGWNRPRYQPEALVRQALANLLGSPFITGEDADRCRRIAERLSALVTDLDTSRPCFVHADLHLGNVLDTGQQWVCLDFDECGFGPRAFDLGVVRLHLRPTDRLSWWPMFIAGYGDGVDSAPVRVGTALRIWYMAGKIPERQDILALRQEPAARIRRYCRYISAELDGIDDAD